MSVENVATPVTTESAVDTKNRVVGTLVYTTGGLIVLFFWLLFGDFAIFMRERSAMPSITVLMQQFHASNFLMGLFKEALPAAVGLFIVPIVAFKSDRHRSSRGRRIPFLVIPTPIGALAMIGIGYCPVMGNTLHSILGDMSPGLDACVLTLFGFFWTIFESVAIVTLAIFTALIADVVPNGLLGRFYGCFRIVSLVAAIIFSKFIFAYTDTHLREIFLSIGLFYGIAFTLMCMFVREGQYPDPEPEEGAQAHPLGFFNNAKIYLQESFSHSYYLWVFSALAIGLLAPFPFNSFNQVYAGQLGLTKQQLGDLQANSFAISIGLAFFIGWFVDKFNALKVVIAAMALYFISMLLALIYFEGAKEFSVIYMLHVVVSGIYFTANASLPMMLFPKLRFSQFASAAGIVSGLSLLVVGTVQGKVLDWAGSNYKLTLLGSAVFAGIALVLHIVVLYKYKALNGRDPAA